MITNVRDQVGVDIIPGLDYLPVAFPYVRYLSKAANVTISAGSSYEWADVSGTGWVMMVYHAVTGSTDPDSQQVIGEYDGVEFAERCSPDVQDAYGSDAVGHYDRVTWYENTRVWDTTGGNFTTEVHYVPFFCQFRNTYKLKSVNNDSVDVTLSLAQVNYYLAVASTVVKAYVDRRKITIDAQRMREILKAKEFSAEAAMLIKEVQPPVQPGARVPPEARTHDVLVLCFRNLREDQREYVLKLIENVRVADVVIREF